MHKYLPNVFIFLDQHNKLLFENNNINIGIIYRNYESKNRETELLKIANACKKKRYQLYVSNDSKLAIRFKADGIYIPSFNKTKSYLNLENRNLKVIGSAHNQIQIQSKIKQKCTAIFLAPLFPVKKKNDYLNIHKFNFLTRSRKINMIALGGINEKNISKLKLLNVKGFGAISLFKKKPAYKGRFF